MAMDPLISCTFGDIHPKIGSSGYETISKYTARIVLYFILVYFGLLYHLLKLKKLLITVFGIIVNTRTPPIFAAFSSIILGR